MSNEAGEASRANGASDIERSEKVIMSATALMKMLFPGHYESVAQFGYNLYRKYGFAFSMPCQYYDIFGHGHQDNPIVDPVERFAQMIVDESEREKRER